LPADVAALADGLDAAEDQAIRMWHIQLVDGTVFVIFELLRTRALAGVVKTADQRIVNQWGRPPH
jgi:hypothetical protein